MGRKTRFAIFSTLAALLLLSGCPGPTYEASTLRAIAAESRHLMATYPIGPLEHWAEVPRSDWPPAIASVRPEIVTVWPGRVDITIVPFFDGGWGYEVPLKKENLGIPLECQQALPQGVYWHGPC